MYAKRDGLDQGLFRGGVGLLGVLMALVQCGGESMIILDLDPASVPDGVASMRLRSQLNGDTGQEAIMDSSPRRIVVYLPPDASGQVQLELDALDTAGCRLALLTLTEPVPGGLGRYVERTVALTPSPDPLCTVPKLVRVAKGTFMMGSTAASDPERDSSEAQHSVTLTTDFGMAETEVTQRQYRNLMGSNPSGFMGDELPVETVSWLDAVTYCNALSVKEKLAPCYQIIGPDVAWKDGVKCVGYRLPTEAEWEYAARSPANVKYAGSDGVDAVAWYESTAGKATHAVKTKLPNGRGLYDLSGNVWEWVWDRYIPNYETLISVDPIGPPGGSTRVFRGGSWLNGAAGQRVAYRNGDPSYRRDQYLGFRLVRSYP